MSSNKNNSRIIEVQVQIDPEKWQTIPFENLKIGNTFRVFDDGKVLKDDSGNTQWTVTREPYFNENGILSVDTKN